MNKNGFLLILVTFSQICSSWSMFSQPAIVFIGRVLFLVVSKPLNFFFEMSFYRNIECKKVVSDLKGNH